MGLPHSKRLGYALAASLMAHVVALVAVFGGRGGSPGPLRMPGLFFVELINLGTRGAEASMVPEPTPFVLNSPGPDRSDTGPLPALDTANCNGREPLPEAVKLQAKKTAGLNPAGLLHGDQISPEISLPSVDLEPARPPAAAEKPAGVPEVPLSPPQCAHCPAPRYPALAQERGLEGEVVLKIEVLADGRVGDVYVMSSSGFPSLDDAALAAVKGWTFYPATRDNVPAPTSQQIRIPFVLPAP